MSSGRVEIIYFYSDLYESKGKLSRLSRKIQHERKDVKIQLVNVDDPKNEELTELYDVNTIPLIIFLTPEGKIAARRFLSLSAEDVVHEIVDEINKGTLPNHATEEIQAKLLESLKSSVKRDPMMELIAEEIVNDLSEASLEPELYERINAHISKINHMISDLTELKKALQRYSKRQNDFVV